MKKKLINAHGYVSANINAPYKIAPQRDELKKLSENDFNDVNNDNNISESNWSLKKYLQAFFEKWLNF